MYKVYVYYCSKKKRKRKRKKKEEKNMRGKFNHYSSLFKYSSYVQEKKIVVYM